jgi:VanZ family protein
MENEQFDLSSEARYEAWSNRILTLAIAGILFLTLYPFRFNFHGAATRGITNPFLLGSRLLKTAGFLDAFLNVLLFIPFGFGLTEKLRERGRSPVLTLTVALIFGALFSYGIEFLQIYIPERDSGWEDVFTNSTGSVVGCILFLFFGGLALRILSVCEQALDALLVGWRVAVVFVLYFGLWFAVSVLLQRETRLANWRPDAFLSLGRDGASKTSWSGRIQLLQFWDHAISKATVLDLLSSNGSEKPDPSLRGYYDFSSPPPYHDRQSFLPDLDWVPQNPTLSGESTAVFDGSSWLTSRVPVSTLAQDLGKTNQFSLRVVCTPARGTGAEGKIVSVSEPSGVANLILRQEDTSLVFWFRNGLSARRSSLTSSLPNVFAAAQTRDIIYTYDGLNLFVYVDAKRQPAHYRFGPGATLVAFLRKTKIAELNGYELIYYALVFFPAGALLGIAGRSFGPNAMQKALLYIVVMIFVPLLLETILARFGDTPFSSSHLALSLALVVTGSFWINADRNPFWTAR